MRVNRGRLAGNPGTSAACTRSGRRESGCVRPTVTARSLSKTQRVRFTPRSSTATAGSAIFTHRAGNRCYHGMLDLSHPWCGYAVFAETNDNTGHRQWLPDAVGRWRSAVCDGASRMAGPVPRASPPSRDVLKGKHFEPEHRRPHRSFFR
jgi:hypothetical protein